jgi:cellulose synthase (UDP-forming)
MFLNSSTSQKNSSRSRLLTVLLIPALLGLGFLIRLPLVWTDQAILSGLLILCSIVLGRMSESRTITLGLTVLSVFCTLRYGVWRWTNSISYLNNSGWHVDIIGLIFALLLLLAETYAIGILVLGYFQSARPLKRRPVPLPSDTDQWPSIDVYIPTYNEPLDVVRPTVLAAMGIDWPTDRLNVYILDDGRRESFRQFAAECGVGYLTRFDNAHAKAGNINSALKVTKSEYIAIFDCDHIATRSFLQVTMGWFMKDRRLAMVQTPHHFYSPDPFERNLNVFRKIPNEGALFYGVVQDGNDLWNATFFCGSCAVIKREALEQIGGIAVETVTEDAHTALRLQRLGWNTAYLGIPQAAGLATGSLSAHVGQRIRWARGMVQILRTECPLFASGLKLPQRLCYLNCVIHYLYAIPRLIFVSAPLVYLILGKSNLYGYIWEIIAYAAPHLVLSNMVNSRTQGDHRHSFWNEVYEMVLAPYILLPTTFALINPKWGKFNVTAKSSVVEETFFDWKIARPYLVLIALNVVGIAMAIPRYLTGGDPSGVLAINVVWAFLNMLMLGACVAVALESKQRRSTVRVDAPLTATLIASGDEVHHCRVIDLSEGGVALRSERILNVKQGQEAIVVLRSGDEEYRFPVEAVRIKDNRIHMRFLADDLQHQRAITKIVYARADSWLDWTKDQSRDRILSSLVHVFGIGAHGLWMLPSLLIKRERKASAKEEIAGAAKPVLLPAILLCCLGFSAHQAKAETTAFQDHQSLQDLGRKKAVVLEGAEAKASVVFTLPSTKLVDTASLLLRYQMNRLPAGATASLSVDLNDVEVAAIPLSSTSFSPEVSHIALPSDLLVHDNTLAFRLSQQCPAPCKASPGDFGTLRIEPSTELETSGTVFALPNRLSMLPAPFFDPSIHRPVVLPFVFASQPDHSVLKAAGIIASWYGVLADYRGAHFTASTGKIPPGNAILLARSDSELAGQLGLSGADSTIALCDNPSDPYGKVLALIGRDSAELIRLANALALNQVQADTDRVSITDVRVPESTTASDESRWPSPDKPLAIAKGITESLLHVKQNSPAKLYFRIPPDLDYGAITTVPLHLRFQRSGMSSQQRVTIAINLNGVAIAERELKASGSSEPETQSFAVPVTLLYPGNTLTVEFAANRTTAPAFDLANLDLRILPDTDLDLKNPARFVRLPRLDLFAAVGFPFTSKRDLSQTAVLLPSTATNAQIGLYLDAIGFLGAQTGYPAFRFDIADMTNLSQVSGKDFLVIGSSNDSATFQPFAANMLLKPTEGGVFAGDFSLPWNEWLSRSAISRREEIRKLSNLLAHESAPTFLIEQCASPWQEGRSVIVLATKSETDDEDYFTRLMEETRQGNISGGLALADGKQFHSFDLATNSYTLGAKASPVAIYSSLRFYLWLVPVLLIIISVGVGRWWEEYLEQQAEERLRIAK